MNANSDYMVVGLDGSPGSAEALAWAAARTDRFGRIRPVSAWHYPWWAVVPFSTTSFLPPPGSSFDQSVRLVAEHMLARLDSGEVSEPLTIQGPAGPILVKEAAGASLLVVGTRGHGAVADSLLGSVSLHCVHHATCPVAVVPPATESRERSDRVVVGLDGSNSAQTALEWALANTAASTKIEIIHVWDSGGAEVAQVAALAEEELATLAAKLVRDTVQSLSGQSLSGQSLSGQSLSGQSLSGRTRVIEGSARRGDARQVLRAASKDAEMLVVGAGEHSGLARYLGGSVAVGLAHQPLTTTVIVR